MSRDWTPKEMLAAEQMMQQNNGISLFDLMKYTTVTVDGVESPWHSEEEIARREQYPLLGKLLNNFDRLYSNLSEIDGGLDVLSRHEKELEAYVSSGEGDKGSTAIMWFEGKLDPSFYYSDRNEEMYSESIHEEAIREAMIESDKALDDIEEAPRTMKVVLLEPGKMAEIADIDASLEGMQKIVGGYIEAFYPYEEEVCIVVNEEGKLNGLPLNRAVYDQDTMIDIIAGTCFICDCSGEDFDSLSEEQLNRYMEKFKYPERFFRVNEKIHAVRYDPGKPTLTSQIEKAQEAGKGDADKNEPDQNRGFER